MAKKSMIAKQQRKQKFSTENTQGVVYAVDHIRVLKKYGICRICFRELAYKVKYLV